MMRNKTTVDLGVDARALREEQEHIRRKIGAIGGTSRRRLDTAINITFLLIVVCLFVLEIGFGLIPSMLSIEIGVALVSVKIIMVMTSMQRVSHYEFWILNTIDFRISRLENEVRQIAKSTSTGEEQPGAGPTP